MRPVLWLAVLSIASGAASLGARPQAGGAPSAPGQAPRETREVRIVARTQEKTRDRVFASGAVEIHYGEVHLFADRVEYNLETGDVLAEGNVVVQLPDEVTRAERVTLNLETRTGRVERASGLIRPSVMFEADSLEKKSDDLFSLRRASVTACTQPTPRWSFTFSRADLKKDDSIQMWNAVLRVKNVPVFYLPYLKYPLEKSRSTGFLMPRIGFSGPKGLVVSQSFYWAIAPNLDATIGFDYYFERGLGAGLEYRYLLPRGTGGELNLYYFSYKKPSEGASPRSSSIVRLKHTQALPLGFTLAANVDYQTSFDFLREFDNDFRRAVVSNRSSQVYLSRSWTRFNFSARASRFETYFSQLDDSIVSVQLPQVNFNVFKVRLLRPLYFSLNTAFNAWQYGWRSEYRSGTERRSSDLKVSPALSWPLTSVPWLTAAVSLTGHLAYYGQSLDPDTNEIVSKPLFAPNYVFNIELTGPVLYKIFYGRDGRPRFKNIIEPSASYSYDSPVREAGRIVTSYGFYRFHQLTYGLASRWLVKGEERTLEILSFNLGQTYYLSPDQGPLSPYPVDGKAPRFSEITGTLRYYPRGRFSLDVSAAYNPYYRNLSNLRLSATVGSKSDGEFLSLSWSKSLNTWFAGGDPALRELYNRHQVSVYGGLRLPALSMELLADADYNIGERKLLYTGAQVVYHYQCLDFGLDVRVFYFRARPEAQIKFSLGLGAIGRTMDFLGGMGF